MELAATFSYSSCSDPSVGLFFCTNARVFSNTYSNSLLGGACLFCNCSSGRASWIVSGSSRQRLNFPCTFVATKEAPLSTTTDRGFTTVNAISSKKRGGSHKTKDLDDDGDIIAGGDLKYKPLGFGQGKTYDVSLEEDLLQQIERQNAAALLRQKTKAAPKKTVAKSNLEHSTIVGGIKVWVGNLPKKRNIERDLRSAFRHTPGLLDISPSVHGNEKTRDPICKGFGFLTFDTLEHAKSFIASFEGQPITFGKVEKHLSFSITKASGAEVISSDSKSSLGLSKLRVRDKDAVIVADSHTESELSRPLRYEDRGIAVDAMQEREHAQSFQPVVEVIQNEEEYDKSSGEEESDYDSDFDDESEIEVSVEIVDPPVDSDAIINRPQGNEDKKLSDAERHIEELEERLRKKLAIAESEFQKKDERLMRKPKGFSTRKAGATKKSSPLRNNIAAVTHGLKRREREVMTGVLEKYGRGPSPTKR